MHHQHTGLLCLGSIVNWARMTSYPNLAIGRGFDACQQFSEGRLSRSIGATDGENLTCVSLEIDSVERLHAWVMLLDADSFEGKFTYR